MIEDEIRPFVRAARPVVPDLGLAAERFDAATPDLTRLASKTQPARQHGRLQPERGRAASTWPTATRATCTGSAGLGHNGNSLFSGGDANGSYRRIYLSQSCETALNIVGSVDPALEAFRQLLTGLTDPVLSLAGCS